MSTSWKVVYHDSDQIIEQRRVGSGEDVVAEERTTWLRETPEQRIADLEDALAMFAAELLGGAE